MEKSLRPDESSAKISPRQHQLLLLLGEGLTLQQAADRMGISRKSANDHKGLLLYRLSLDSRKDLLTYTGRLKVHENRDSTNRQLNQD